MSVKSASNWIKLLEPSASQAEISAVVNVLKSGWWGMGPVTGQFEQEFAKFAGVKYAIALNSCSAALHLAYKMLPKKGNIITTPLTFVSTASEALKEGQQVIFADIQEDSFCLNPEKVKELKDKNTQAIVPVHYAGRLANLDYGQIKNITIIEDCAHAAGTGKAGSKGLLSCWSFHAVKNIGSGDGGMLTTNDPEIANRAKQLRWCGINLSTHDREKKGYNWEYQVSEIGYKYHANDIMSALSLVQLRRLRTLNAKRKKIAQKYYQHLKSLPLILPPNSESWHLFVIRVDKKYRDKLVGYLRSKKISPGVHYKPLYYYPIFGKDPKKEAKRLPVTQKIWQEIISIPIHPNLTQDQQSKVIDALRAFFK